MGWGGTRTHSRHVHELYVPCGHFSRCRCLTEEVDLVEPCRICHAASATDSLRLSLPRIDTVIAAGGPKVDKIVLKMGQMYEDWKTQQPKKEESMKMSEEVKLGAKVKDTLTGFEGIVLGRCQYLTGCTQVLVQPAMKEGKEFVESRWFDEPRLIVSDPTYSHELASKPEVRTTGGDKPAPRK